VQEAQTILDTPDRPLAPPVLEDDKNKDVFRVARALVQLSKTRSASYRQSFDNDWKFLLGENHYPVPSNARAAFSMAGKDRGVRNWLFATCDQKAQIILGAKPRFSAIPFGGPTDFYSRWQAQEVIEELHRQLDADRFDEDALWDGMATGKGYTRVYVEADPRSGLAKLCMEACDPGGVLPDPEASCIDDADHMTYETWMSMAKIRRYFPMTWHKVKAQSRGFDGANRDNIVNRRRRTESEILLSAGGQEFASTEKGDWEVRGDFVAMTWIKNEEVVHDIESRMLHGEREGYSCADCKEIFDAPIPEPAAIEADLDGDGLPDPMKCPNCASEALAPITIPAQSEDYIVGRRFRYPYGQFVVTTKDCILWGDPEKGEGQNPDKIDCIFPIFEYHHYRVPGRFKGPGEVDALRSAQVNANKNIRYLMDYLRTSVNGVLEYPSKATQYANMANWPNPKIGLPPPLIGLARYLPPAPFNVQAFMAAEQIIKEDFQKRSGVTDTTYGMAPQMPTSGKEFEARHAASTTRIDGHIRHMNRYRSKRGTAVWQLAWQHFRTARYFPVRDSNGQEDMVPMTVRELPRNLKVHVSAEIEDAQRGELLGQVLQGLMTTPNPTTGQPLLPTWFDVLLPAAGLRPSEASTVMDRMKLHQFEQAQAAEQQPQEMTNGMGQMTMDGGQEMPEGMPQEMPDLQPA
jgi:hypothetical protein